MPPSSASRWGSDDPPVAATSPEEVALILDEEMVPCTTVTLCVSRRAGTGEPMLMIAGLGMQLIAWPSGFLDALEEVGFAVITYDQRDVGRSTYFDSFGRPDLLAALRHDGSRLAYRLEDLANDAVGLLDALGIARAHLFGVSMGAMVAQLIALQHPERALSLCSAMGSTGDRAVGQSSNAALSVLLRPAARSEEEMVAQRLAQLAVTSGSEEELDEAAERELALRSYRRAHHPEGSARQLAALLAAPDRSAALSGLSVPTLVLHGSEDQMVAPSGGLATAAAIPGARLLLLEQMGHELPVRSWHEIAEAVASNARRAAF